MDEPESRPSLRPEDLKRIGRLIGIKFRTTIVMCDAKLIDRNKLLIEKFIPRDKRRKNKKLSGE